MEKSHGSIGRASDLNDDLNNPCKKEHRLSNQCLSDNCYDKEKCSMEFQNYRNCMAFWMHVRKERRKEGIRPELPYPEDREKIKKQFLQTMKIKNPVS